MAGGQVKDAEVIGVRSGRRPSRAIGPIAAMIREDLRIQVEAELGVPVPVHLARLAKQYAGMAQANPAYASATIAALKEAARYCYRPLAHYDHEKVALAKAELAKQAKEDEAKPAVALYRLPDNGRVPAPEALGKPQTKAPAPAKPKTKAKPKRKPKAKTPAPDDDGGAAW
jgi:hypothetical protein